MVFRQYPVFLAPIFFLMGIPNISGVFQYFFQPFPKLNLNCYTVDSCSLFFHGLPLSSLWLCLCTILTTMGPLVELEGMWLRWMVDWLIHSFSFFFLPSNLQETSWRKLWRNVLSWDNILINTRFLIHRPIHLLFGWFKFKSTRISAKAYPGTLLVNGNKHSYRYRYPPPTS